MASSLLRRLSYMNKPTNDTPAPVSGVKLFEKSFPPEEGLFHLNQTALLRMGLTGGLFDIQKTVFIDTETTGLSGGAGTVAFLIGYGFVQNDRFIVRQLLMPDYSAETEMLLTLKNDLERFETAVHFNGRRFDLPLISQRCVMKRMEDAVAHLEQLDLMYPSRSVWKLRLGCCKLSYLESTILGMPERDDIPGSEIPQRYFDSVRMHDTELLNDVINHNRQDIVTLGVLLCKLNQLFCLPESADETMDLYSLGRTFERQGEYRCAKGLYLKASRPRPLRTAKDLRDEKYFGEANMRLFLLYRRSKEYEKCEQTLLNMIKRRQMGQLPYLELCKLYEHRLKRYNSALELCEKLLETASEEEAKQIYLRKQRIQNKINKSGRT